MDGTLLDLRFDNYFWLEVLPERYARRHELSLEAARATLAPRFAAKQGTLDWYCIDFWSRELSLDIAELKREVRAHVRFLPGAERFLQTLHARGLDPVLVTNAHRDVLEIKAGADRAGALLPAHRQLARPRRAEGASRNSGRSCRRSWLSIRRAACSSTTASPC